MKIQLRLMLLLSLCFVFQLPPSFGQRKVAYQHALHLKDGVLLVRLGTYQKKLDLLREAGKTEEAKVLETQLRYKNQALVRAFTSKFDFCPVLFFWSDQAREISTDNFYTVLMDESLQANTKPVPSDKVYVAAVSYLGMSSEFVRNKREGIIIMDRNFNYLPDPFPDQKMAYFKKWSESYELPADGQLTMEEKAVETFNQKLHDFYEKAARKMK